VIAEAILYLQPPNKTFMLRKVLLTFLAVAPIAEQSANNKTEGVIPGKVSVLKPVKCMTLPALLVANQRKFLSGPAVTGPYTAVIVIHEKTVVIN
jgi:hypothetical protein